MSDNLAHKLNNFNLSQQFKAGSQTADFSNSNEQELSLDRLRYQAGRSAENKSTPDGNAKTSANNGGSISQQLGRAKNAATNILAGNASGAAEEVTAIGTQEGSKWLLTTLWSSVWVDFTLLSLLGLNIFLAASILLPQYCCQFGEDYLFGKWMPSKDLAKWTEIMLLLIIDFLIIAILTLIFYIFYKIITNPYESALQFWWNGNVDLNSLE